MQQVLGKYFSKVLQMGIMTGCALCRDASAFMYAVIEIIGGFYVLQDTIREKSSIKTSFRRWCNDCWGLSPHLTLAWTTT